MDKVHILNGVEFEWDVEKYALNVRKHGVTFEEAAEIFFDNENIYGDASAADESRHFVVGFSIRFNLFVHGICLAA